MRLSRQPTGGDWTTVVVGAAEALRQTLRSKGEAQSENPPSRIKSQAEVFLEAQRLHQEGRLSEAETLYRRVLRGDPDHVGALHALGVMVARRGDHASGQTLIERAWALAPNNPTAPCTIAKLYQ